MLCRVIQFQPENAKARIVEQAGGLCTESMQTVLAEIPSASEAFIVAGTSTGQVSRKQKMRNPNEKTVFLARYSRCNGCNAAAHHLRKRTARLTGKLAGRRFHLGREELSGHGKPCGLSKVSGQLPRIEVSTSWF